MKPTTLAGEVLSVLAIIGFFVAAPSAASAEALPSPWKSRDIGNPSVSGSGIRSGSKFIVTGAGADIDGNRDEFHFVYQPVEGNVEIVARLSALESADALNKAGIMIRASLAGSAANASVLGSPAIWTFQRRLSEGATTHDTNGPRTGVPGWVKLVREGKLFSAYHSSDGSNWRLVDTDTIVMPSTIYVGLAVTSRNVASARSATFTNVLVREPVDRNDPPRVSVTSPSSSDRFTAPASVLVKATAEDSDGTVSRVDFFRGGTLIGSDSESPFGVTWKSVGAGTYSLTAVAIDNDGASSVSSAVSILVKAASTEPPNPDPPPDPPTPGPIVLAFTASVDHAALVLSYTVAIYRAGDPLSATPLATRNIGKPKPVGGDISVDITTLVKPLGSGTYKAVVKANGASGSNMSAPSPSFAM